MTARTVLTALCLLIAASALSGCAAAPAKLKDGYECAPNGTCWPENLVLAKKARVYKIDKPADVCAPALHAGGWTEYLEGKAILACTIGKTLPQPIVYLPKTLPGWALERGWTLEMLKRYELANAEGLAVYPQGAPLS